MEAIDRLRNHKKNVDEQREQHPELEKSFLIHSSWMTILGIIFPLVFLLSTCFGHTDPKPSISAYYWTKHFERNFFVGALFAIGTFLITYKGQRFWDDQICNVAGICAWGIAFFPTENADNDFSSWTCIFHKGFAILFFFCIIMLLFYMKWHRIQLPDKYKCIQDYYKWFAGALVIVLLATIICHLFLKEEQKTYLIWGFGPIFYIESILIWLFAFNWAGKTVQLWTGTPIPTHAQ